LKGDLILAVFLLIGLIWGYKCGIIRCLAGFGSIIISLVLARRFTPYFGNWLNQKIGLEDKLASLPNEGIWPLFKTFFVSDSVIGWVMEALAFIILFFIFTWLLRILFGFISKALDATPLGFINRVLGMLVGLVFVALISAAITGWGLPALAFGSKDQDDFMYKANNMFQESKIIRPVTEDFAGWCVDSVKRQGFQVPSLSDYNLPSISIPDDLLNPSTDIDTDTDTDT